jgi:hypothetical protein
MNEHYVSPTRSYGIDTQWDSMVGFDTGHIMIIGSSRPWGKSLYRDNRVRLVPDEKQIS